MVRILVRGQCVFSAAAAAAFFVCGCIQVTDSNSYDAKLRFAYKLRPGEYAIFVHHENTGAVEVQVNE